MISLSSRCSISPYSDTTDHDALGDLPQRIVLSNAPLWRCSPVPVSWLPICPTPPPRLNPLPIAMPPLAARAGSSPPRVLAAGSPLLPTPRCAGVTAERSLLCGANTPARGGISRARTRRDGGLGRVQSRARAHGGDYDTARPTIAAGRRAPGAGAIVADVPRGVVTALPLSRGRRRGVSKTAIRSLQADTA
jgi:hypothetical protein